MSSDEYIMPHAEPVDGTEEGVAADAGEWYIGTWMIWCECSPAFVG